MVTTFHIAEHKVQLCIVDLCTIPPAVLLQNGSSRTPIDCMFSASCTHISLYKQGFKCVIRVAGSDTHKEKDQRLQHQCFQGNRCEISATVHFAQQTDGHKSGLAAKHRMCLVAEGHLWRID